MTRPEPRPRLPERDTAPISRSLSLRPPPRLEDELVDTELVM